jgi:hypothetical protein
MESETKKLTHYEKYKDTIYACHERDKDKYLTYAREYSRKRREKIREEKQREKELFAKFKELIKN